MFYKRIILFLLASALLLQPTAWAQNNESKEYLTALTLLSRMTNEFQNIATHDRHGLIVSLIVPSKYQDNDSLHLISKLQSIQILTLFGNYNGTTPMLTADAISHLNDMSNLVSLKLACFVPHGLSPGVLSNVARITRLSSLHLHYAEPPDEEYLSIGKLTNLTTLEIIKCGNFGNKELSIVTNLPKLTTLTLIDTGVSSSGTNVIAHAKSITNFYYRSEK